MGSVDSEEEGQSSERGYGSYTISVDVSESESSTSSRSFSLRRHFAAPSSSSFSSSPLPLLSSSTPVLVEEQELERMTSSLGLPTNKTLICLRDSRSFYLERKEIFAKLLLGEDMSGSGKGVCKALAITNLSATVFGELWRLEPLAPQRKAMWRREMEWLLCISDSIVELIPSIQQFPGGGTYEVMAPRPRSDLYMNLPALKKLDAMLISTLDGFRDTELWYVDRGIVVADEGNRDAYLPGISSGRPSIRQEDKWWLPCPKIPPNGLSDDARKQLQQCRECTNQILKAAMAINSSVLLKWRYPLHAWIPCPSGKACLGDIIYCYIKAKQFSPECLLDCLDLSTEHGTLVIANRIEAAAHVCKLKGQRKLTKQARVKQSSWDEKVKGLVTDTEKNQFLAKRSEILLQSLGLRVTDLPQTCLDMNKIQYNKDVGQAILESYSRVLESLAFNIMARIDDVLFVDDAIKKCVVVEAKSILNRGLNGLPLQKRLSPSPFSIQPSPFTSPFATPTFCPSTPMFGSPGRAPSSTKSSNVKDALDWKIEKPLPSDFERVWSYAGNLNARRVSGDAPERD